MDFNVVQISIKNEILTSFSTHTVSSIAQTCMVIFKLLFLQRTGMKFMCAVLATLFFHSLSYFSGGVAIVSVDKPLDGLRKKSGTDLSTIDWYFRHTHKKNAFTFYFCSN